MSIQAVDLSRCRPIQAVNLGGAGYKLEWPQTCSQAVDLGGCKLVQAVDLNDADCKFEWCRL